MNDEQPDEQLPVRPGRLKRLSDWLMAHPLALIIIMCVAVLMWNVWGNFFYEVMAPWLVEHHIKVYAHL